MPIPKKKSTESKKEFIKRCMNDKTMIVEYPYVDQRYAICIRESE